MATRIPLPGAPGEALLRGVDTGSAMFSRLMQPKIQREQLAQQQQQFAQQQALREAQEARAQELFPLQKSGLQLGQDLQRTQESRLAELHPVQLQRMMEEERRQQETHPYNISGKQATQDYQKAQADYQREQAEKSRWQRDPQAQSDYMQQLLSMVSDKDGNIDWNDPKTIFVMEKLAGHSMPYTHPTALQKEASTISRGNPELYPQTLSNLRHQYYDPQAFGQQDQVRFEQEDSSSQSQMNPAMREMLEVNNHLNNAISMGPYTPGEKTAARKRMNEEMKEIQSSKLIMNKISQAEKIMQENPDLYRKAVGIIFDPDREGDKRGFIASKRDALLRAGIPQEQLTPFLELDKLFMDIVNKQAEKLGGRGTNMARQMLQRAKASAKNPDDANRFILSSLRKELQPIIAREKALNYALSHGLDLPYSINYDDIGSGLFSGLSSDGAANQAQDSGQMLRGEIDGQEVPVHPTQKDDFEKAGGRIL